MGTENKTANLGKQRVTALPSDGAAPAPSIEALTKSMAYVPGNVLVADDNGTIRYASPHMLAFSGYDQEELIGSPMTSFWDLPADTAETIMASLRNDRFWQGEIKQKLKRDEDRSNGRDGWELVSLSIVPSDETGKSYIVKIGQSVDHSKQDDLETRLSQSETDLQALMGSTPFVITIYRLSDRRFIDVSNSFCQRTGYEKEEVLGRTAIELGMFKDLADREKFAATLERDGQINDMEIQYLSKSGEIIDAVISARPITFKGETCVLTSSVDVTELRKTQRALKESELLYRTLMEAAPESIVLTRLVDGKIVHANAAFYQRTGWSPEETLGHTTLDLNIYVNPEDRKKFVSILKKDGRVNAFQAPIRYRDGTTSFELWSARVIEILGEQHLLVVTRDMSELLAVREALEESERSYRTILETSPNAVAISRLSDSRYVLVNEAFTRSTGYTRQDAIGRQVSDLNLFETPADRDRLLETFLSNGRVDAMEARFRKKDGSITESLISARPIQYRNEPCILIISTNIDTLKEAQRALTEREANYRTILETAPYTIVITRMSDGAYIEVNEACCRRIGYAREEIIGKSALELNLYHDLKDRDRLLERLQRNGQVSGMEIQFRAKDGKPLESLVSAASIKYQGQDCFITMTVDITQQKRIQQELKEREASYRTILETSPYSIAISSIKDGAYVEVNDAFVKRTGYSREELIGNTPEKLNFYEDPADHERLVAALHPDGRVSSMEINFRVKDGTVRESLISTNPIRYRGRWCLLAMIVDVSALKQVQRTLAENEATYRTILDTVPYSISLSRLSDATYLHVNEGFIQNTGFTREEVIGATALDLNLYADLREREHIFELLRQQGHVDGEEIAFRTKSGETVHSLLSCRVIAFKGEQCLLAVAIDISHMKKMQQELAEREEGYRTILETAPYSVMITSAHEGKYVEVNNTFTKRTGYTRQEAIGRTSRQLNLYKDDAERNRLFRLLQEERQVEGLEMSFRRKDGSFTEGLISTSPIRYHGQECWLSMIVDINALKETQRALVESEANYRTILDSAPYSIIVTRLSDSLYMQVNEAFCRRTGYSREEAIGRTPYDLNIFVDAADRKKMLEIFNRDGRVESMEINFRSKDGKILESLFSVTPITYNGEACLLAMTVDIGQQKAAERARRRSEQKYRNVLMNMEEGYWEVDLKGNFIFVNDAECRIHRCTAKELVGKNNRDYTTPETAQKVVKTFNAVYRTGMPAMITDYEMTRQDGTTAFIDSSISLLKDETGTPIGFYGIARDITEKKKAADELEKYRKDLEQMVRERTEALEAAQNELVKREKLSVLGQLTATVSHELRNPLGVIRSSNFYLQRKLAVKDPKVEKHFRRIEDQVGMCDTIVADLLEYTRGRNVSMEKALITPWLNQVIDQMEESHSASIERNLNDHLPPIHHDQEKMRRVCINLIDNAIQATQARVEAEERSGQTFQPVVQVSTSSDDHGISIEICDNGIGMDEITLKRAFEPLFTTRSRGTGIGLANVQKIMKEHGGSVTISSEAGFGTTVTVTLRYRPDSNQNSKKGNLSSGEER